MKLRLSIMLLLISTTCFAVENDLPINNLATFEAQMYHLDYTETIHHRTFDEVYGFAPGVKMNIRKTIKNFVIQPELVFRRADLTYRGGASGDTFLTLTTDTESFIFDANFLLGYLFELQHQQNLIPYVKYGYRRWLREVPPIGYLTIDGNRSHIGVNSYTETYQNQYFLLGLEYQNALNDVLTLALFAGAGTTFHAEMFANSQSWLGCFSLSRHYHLGDKPMYETGFKMDFKLNDTWHANFNMQYTDFAYGKSQAVLFSLEPNSTTQEVSVGFGISAEIA